MLNMRGIFSFLFVLMLTCSAHAQSQPPSQRGLNLGGPKQSDSSSGNQKSQTNTSNPNQPPIIVKIIQPPESEEAAKRETQRDQQETRNNRWNLYLTGVLGIAALLQFRTFVVMIYRTGRQLRAYVFLEQIGIFSRVPMALNPPPGPMAGAVPQIFIQIKNWGQTPAYEVHHQAFVSIHPLPIYRAPAFRGGGGSKSHIAPGSGTNNAYFPDENEPISTEEWDEIVSGRLAIYVFGQISYRDIFSIGLMRHFSKPKITQYRLMHWAGSPIGSNNMTFCDDGNRAT